MTSQNAPRSRSGARRTRDRHPCGCEVNKNLTKPSRSVCGRPGRRIHVDGIGRISIVACSRHRRRFEALGLRVTELTPLEEKAAFNELTTVTVT